MFFHWSDKKDEEKRAEYKGIGFADVQTIFDAYYYCEPNDGYPGQYIVVGFVAKAGDLFTVACEDRVTRDGREFIHLATFWKADKRERRLYEEKNKRNP